MNIHDEDELLRLREMLQARLEQLLPADGQQDLVYQAMREGSLSAGKRIRPLLLMLTARDLGCRVAQPGLIDLACAVEMVHAASLMLDDTPCMDNAMLRRGRPTIHRLYGENVAILAAVALLSRAFGVIADAQSLSAGHKMQAVAELSRAVGEQGLVQGQYLDLSEGAGTRTPEAILLANELKTSRLFDATLQMAAISANASDLSRQCLRAFALDLGQAFQLLDDLCDGVSGTGKDLNKDGSKSTLVATLGAEAVRLRLYDHLRSADAHFADACHHGKSTRQFMHAWFDRQLAQAGMQQAQFLPEC